MGLQTNLQRVVADSLRRGFGIAMPDGYDPTSEHFVRSSGDHVGMEIISCFEDPAVVRAILDRSREWLEHGNTLYATLLAAASDDTITMKQHIVRWGEMFRALYSGAVDHIVPMEWVRRRLSELLECSPQSRLIFDIFTPHDGKTILFYHDHALLLHLAHAFRDCPTGRWIDTYDAFSRSWLALNYMPLSLDDAVNVHSDPSEAAINRRLRELSIESSEYCAPVTNAQNERNFQVVRAELTQLMWERKRFTSVAQAARDELLKQANSPSVRERADALIMLIGGALQMNEAIHHRVYLGLNILRLIAQARCESGLNLTFAFAGAAQPGCPE